VDFLHSYPSLGSFDERGNKVRQGSEISSWMSVRILVGSGVKSGTTRHPVCSASPAVKRALIEFWSVFSSRMIRGRAQAYFISPFVKCPQMGFVDFLYILQRRDASREFFEARAAGANVPHGSVQDDRIDLRVHTERRSVWFHVAI
jgi:hypothetical protein